MNNYIKIVLTETHRYWCDETDTVEMFFLGRFLASEVGCRRSRFKEWAIDKTDLSSYGGNITFLEKKDNYIIVSDQTSEELDWGPYLYIEQPEFVKLLDEWENICMQDPKPQEVLITYDGKHFTFSCT